MQFPASFTKATDESTKLMLEHLQIFSFQVICFGCSILVYIKYLCIVNAWIKLFLDFFIESWWNFPSVSPLCHFPTYFLHFSLLFFYPFETEASSKLFKNKADLMQIEIQPCFSKWDDILLLFLGTETKMVFYWQLAFSLAFRFFLPSLSLFSLTKAAEDFAE